MSVYAAVIGLQDVSEEGVLVFHPDSLPLLALLVALLLEHGVELLLADVLHSVVEYPLGLHPAGFLQSVSHADVSDVTEV